MGGSDDDDDDREDDDEAEAPEGDDGGGDEPDDSPEPQEADAPDDDSPRVTVAELRVYLSLPATLDKVRKRVARKVPPQRVEDVAADCITRAMGSKWLPRQDAMPAWLARVCRRQIADETRKRKRRQKYEGRLPDAHVARDEAGEPIEDAGDAVVDTDPRTDPTAEDPAREGQLFLRWMRENVTEKTDRETLGMLEEWADAERGTTYKAIAVAHGLTEAALKKRAERLREKYLPPYRKWRNAAFLLLLGGAIVLGIVAVLVWRALSASPPPIGPEPTFRPLRPIPSASATPTDTPFEPAQPPEPAPPIGPKQPGAPPTR